MYLLYHQVLYWMLLKTDLLTLGESVKKGEFLRHTTLFFENIIKLCAIQIRESEDKTVLLLLLYFLEITINRFPSTRYCKQQVELSLMLVCGTLTL